MADKSTVTLYHKDTEDTIETAPGNMDNMAVMGWLPAKDAKKRLVKQPAKTIGEDEDGKP